MADWSCGYCCGCDRKLACLAETLSDESATWSPEELQAMEEVVFCALSCLERHSPNAVARMWARAQLTDDFWRKQKAREMELNLVRGI